MTYNFSSFPHVGSCIPTRTAFITDPWYHNRFDLDYYNHFNLHCHNHFNQLYKKLGLNIQLPEIKVPACPDVTVPECPACPDVAVECPACPDVAVECPACPDVTVPECPACPEPKKPIDFSKLTIAVDAISGEIKDAITKKSSGLIFIKCKEIIDRGNNNLEIGSDNRIRGACDNDSECRACVDAINASIIDTRKESVFFSEKMSVPEDIVDVI